MRDGFPVLLSADQRFQFAEQAVGAYDEIYSAREQVWEDQGRTVEFIRFYANLLTRGQPRRLLEIGCGEGFLLAATQVPEKFAIDLSAEALAKARQKSAASLSVALAERLPFPDASFDVVASVGVMEHFLDDRAASAEILRVLRPGGRYMALIHIGRTTWQKIRQKVSEFLLPVPRPLRFARWLGQKALRPIHQPIQHRYTIASAKACLEGAGFRVKEILHTGVDPSLPLIGPHVVIYVAEK